MTIHTATRAARACEVPSSEVRVWASSSRMSRARSADSVRYAPQNPETAIAAAVVRPVTSTTRTSSTPAIQQPASTPMMVTTPSKAFIAK